MIGYLELSLAHRYPSKVRSLQANYKFWSCLAATDLVPAAVSTSILSARRTTMIVDMQTTASAMSHHFAKREQTALIATSIAVTILLAGIADSLASTRQLLSVRQHE
jgi:hypothetical protein